MNPFQQTNIQITKVEAKMASTGNMKYILTAHDNKRYYFYQKAKGADSSVYQSFTNMGVKQGDTIAISYTEEAKSFVGKDGKPVNYTDRFIGSMREASGVPVSTPQILQPTPSPIYQQYLEPKVRNFDREAYEKCCSIWSAGLMSRPQYSIKEYLEAINNGGFWELFQAIRKDGEKRFSSEPLPEDPGEVNVENIPF